MLFRVNQTDVPFSRFIMSRRKRIALGFALLVAAASLAGAVVKEQADAHFYDDYQPDLALDAKVRADEAREDYRRVDFVYQSLPGVFVPALLALPRDEDGPFPCIVFLHGIGQNKDFLDEIATPYVKAGFAFASYDQYMRGERRLPSKNIVRQALGLRRRAALNVMDTRRLIDYLQTRDDIAMDRIYLIGASFGAITGCAAVAFEPRIQAGVMTYGGADLERLFSSEAAKEELGILQWPVMKFLSYLTAPAEPLKHVGRISPRPLLFQNGDQDRLIPLDAAKAFFDAAGGPKEMTLYHSDHVGLDRDNTKQVLDESLEWLLNVDKKRRDLTRPELHGKETGAGLVASGAQDSLSPAAPTRFR
jgi:dienelactone hydrolase